MVDDLGEKERLALLYDPLNADRCDLDFYVSVVDGLGGRRVLDIGCGTGTFACMLAARGIEVIGLDPDQASLAFAHPKAGCGARDVGPWRHHSVGADGGRCGHDDCQRGATHRR